MLAYLRHKNTCQCSGVKVTAENTDCKKEVFSIIVPLWYNHAIGGYIFIAFKRVYHFVSVLEDEGKTLKSCELFHIFIIRHNRVVFYWPSDS